jgi:hypothetical protein
MAEATAAIARSSPSSHRGDARLHHDQAAATVARALSAEAVTVGRDIYFAAGAPRPGTPKGDYLLRHELAHVAQAPPGATTRIDRVVPADHPAEHAAHALALGRSSPTLRVEPGTALRHPVITTTSQRWTESEILTGGRVPATSGGGSTGPMTLADFADWSTAQPDWFVGLSEGLRTDLWQLHALLLEGPHIRAGLGLMTVANLRPELGNAAHMNALRAYARGFIETENTVSLTVPTAVVATAIDLGERMDWLVTNVGGAALREAMPEADFRFYAGNATAWANLQQYITNFHPFLETADRRPTPDPLSDNARLRRLVTDAAGIGPLLSLAGRIRNLHRFPRALLNDQVRLWGTAGTTNPPVTLAVQSGHDWNNAFAPTDENVLPPLALPSETRFRLLIYEGPESLAAATTVISGLRASFGAIRDVIIVGHGESRQIGLAGAGAPVRGGGFTRYLGEEPLDVGPGAPSTPATEAFFDALLGAMDPATARVVFTGCLVGTTSVPQQVRDAITTLPRPPTDAEIRAFYSDPNRVPLAEWLNARPAATGLSGFGSSFVTGARADTGAPAGVIDPATGRAAIQYNFDPAAFQTAQQYILTGREPTGLMRAIRELMVRNLPLAQTSIALRMATPPPIVDPWWDAIARLMATVAAPAVAANDLVRVHQLDAIAGTVFLTLWSPQLTRDRLVNFSAADAAVLFPAMLAATPGTLYPQETPRMRIVVQQSWAIIDNTRASAFLAELDAMALPTAAAGPAGPGPAPAPRPVVCADIVPLIDAARLGPMLGTLLPVPPPAAPTRGQFLLSLLLAMRNAPRTTAPGAGDPQVLRFLHALAAPTRSLPAAATPLLAGFAAESDILDRLGLGAATSLTPTGPTPSGATDPANARLGGATDATNDVRIEPPAYMATVLPSAVNVRNRPSMSGTPVHFFSRGQVIRVVGWVHDWAAVEFSDRWHGHVGALGFVYRSTISPP